MLTEQQLHSFKTAGFLVIPAAQSNEFCTWLREFARAQLAQAVEPIEYEADTHYPGAPESRDALGGQTARRLLTATARHARIRDWACSDFLRGCLQQLLGDQVYLSQVHHNCIMTKQPRFSSETGWHRDSRYWHYQSPSLVSAWLALNDEFPENGCLWVLPGSHLWQISAEQLDERLFLRKDLAFNEPLLQQAVPVRLSAGDLLFFHSNLFHAASNNSTDQTKFSLVFTYRGENNIPKAETRSTSLPEIAL